MREILFRAKIKDTDEWVEGYYAMMGKENLIRHYIVQNCALTGLFSDPEENMYFNDVEIDPETLCQYTGLTDKNGKRIWENDILHRAYHSEEDYIVVWDDGRFNFKTIHGQYSQDPMTLLSLCFTQINAKRLKVIGNVFDNPELLKGE